MDRVRGRAKTWLVTLALTALLGAAAWGQATAGDTPLPEEMKAELGSQGWSKEAIQALGEQPVDWSAFQARHARLVAAALAYATGADADVGPQEQARVALETCSMIREMESLGYGEIDTARTVFAAVRASLREMADWRSGEGDGELEQRIRSRFRHELRVRTAGQVRAQAREAGGAETGGEAESPVIGPGPGSPPWRN